MALFGGFLSLNYKFCDFSFENADKMPGICETDQNNPKRRLKNYYISIYDWFWLVFGSLLLVLAGFLY
jgi:hypothetical protein